MDEVAKSILDCVESVRDNLITFHGSLSEDKNKKNFSSIVNDYDRNFYVPMSGNLTLDLKRNKSLLFSGLDGININIVNKINHIIFRKCNNCNVLFHKNVISGVNLLYSNEITIFIPFYNYLSLEYVENIKLNGEVNENTNIRILHSDDVKLNDEKLLITMFTNCVYKNNTYFNNNFDIPSLTIGC
jgi:hypothetical protein